MPDQPTHRTSGARWVVVVPVKRLDLAKTRLSRFAGPHRQALALAFACDTVAAALACPAVAEVVAVTDDPAAAAALEALGARVVTDQPDDGLNPALEHGADLATGGVPSAGIAALSSDLPSLRPAELAAALDAATEHPTAFVSDAEGTGTTLLTARTRADFVPRFGHRSRAEHRAAGVAELTMAGLGSLRRDVDTEVDLYDARRLGLGRHSAEALALLDGTDQPRPSSGPCQATVRSFDPETRSGTVLLDDGLELEYDAAAFDVGGLRLVRLGQRVRIEVDEGASPPRVTFLTLVTLPGRPAP